MKPTDVLVVGSGLAGLMAALTVAIRGKTVRLVARGTGGLAISSGCVDVLGYAGDSPVHGNPLEFFPQLPEEHPYRIMGAEVVGEALNFFTDQCAKNGLAFYSAQGQNLWATTSLGSFKPTCLCSGPTDRNILTGAERIIVAHVPWLKDCHAGTTHTLLKRQKRLRDKEILVQEFSSFYRKAHGRRNLTPLDTARFVNTPQGEDWLLAQLEHVVGKGRGEGVAVLLPMVLGLERHNAIHGRLTAEIGCALVEAVSPPPGVGGVRIRQALMKALTRTGISLLENTRVVEARVKGERCISLICDAPDRRRELEADSFIIATGGFLGGGSVASPGKARENIFNLDLGAPGKTEEWSVPDVFASQPYAKLGIHVNNRLNPLSPTGSLLWSNVFFAGRALAGYDFSIEKSGSGVALSSGRYAGLQC